MNLTLHFYVVRSLKTIPNARRNVAYLEVDNWNDFGVYRTQYFLVYVDTEGQRTDIGSVKIGEKGMTSDRPKIPESFVSLTENFFSLGQSREFYETLMKLDNEVRIQILSSLRDIVFDLELLNRFADEEVMEKSLLRDFSAVLVEGQYKRILERRPVLTEIDFTFLRPPFPGSNAHPLVLSFSVVPGSNPPSNVHTLIGRNGVGKSDLLRRMALRFTRPSEPNSTGEFSYFRTNLANRQEKGIFANLVLVAFSVFDPFHEIKKESEAIVGYEYIGVDSKIDLQEDLIGKTDPNEIIRNTFPIKFVEAVEKCVRNNSIERLRRAFENLQSDRLLADQNFPLLFSSGRPDDGDWRGAIRHAFGRLSSGHKIVCLTIAQLVASVAEQTLVLIDEPESHLHPPLLSAFIRSLSDLLIEQNGVAIISTHSPVVLQEVPKECVWIIDRSGDEVAATRPEMETFGENVGALTRDVFQLEVREAGFHTLVEAAAKNFVTYEAALASFGGQLGAEGRVILRGLIETRKASQ